MPLVPMRVLLDHAAENDYGVAAFNVNNMEQIQAIMTAASRTDSPVIIQASSGARSYSDDAYLRHLMLAAVELNPLIPIVMHQAHGNSPAPCASAIEQNFNPIHEGQRDTVQVGECRGDVLGHGVFAQPTAIHQDEGVVHAHAAQRDAGSAGRERVLEFLVERSGVVLRQTTKQRSHGLGTGTVDLFAIDSHDRRWTLQLDSRNV